MLGVAITLAVRVYEQGKGIKPINDEGVDAALRAHWRMPPLDQLAPAKLTLMSLVWMGVLRSYLVIAAGLLLFKLFRMATVESMGV